ncbi:MAG: HU family DNA-binding protein [Epsilonproteobacteria bacterium]|nr:DNA-binding protein [Campylobacterota bacterium]NPA57459.1 HU family DNA-binding protein [Campylobacterota bacterium]
MKKAEFIQAVAEKAGLSKKDTQRVIDAALEVITEALQSGKEVSFIGFGTFTTVQRAAREAKIPGTEQTIKVPATRVVKFKVGKKLKEAVARGES